MQPYVATVVFGVEAHHQSAGIWPWLAAEISDVFDAYARFFEHFALHSLFECLSRLDESCDETVEVAAEVVCVYEKHLAAASYKDDNGRGQLGPYFLSTFLAAFAYLRVHLHSVAADSAEARALVPVEQFAAFSGSDVHVVWQLVVARPQWTHLVVWCRVDGAVNGVCTYLGVRECGGRDVDDVCMRLYFSRRIFAGWYGIRAVGTPFQHYIAFVENKK